MLYFPKRNPLSNENNLQTAARALYLRPIPNKDR